ncbi:MAG: 23S rRNA (pseudouridine(1915)-N(3))-methyltransferase RlmH [Campylobacterales bacterium]
MQKISVVAISKPSKKDFYKDRIDEYIKRSSRFCELSLIEVFNKEIEKSQKINDSSAQEVYRRFLQKEFTDRNIALDPKGRSVDSLEFAKLFYDYGSVNFYIGGAYGFDNRFLESCDSVVSLSPLTFDHKLATLICFEQIYRGFCEKNNHPYATK